MVEATGISTVHRFEYTRTAEVEGDELTFEQEGVYTNDTIHIEEWTTLGGAALVNKSTKAAITCTIATHVITVTGTVSNVTVRGVALRTA